MSDYDYRIQQGKQEQQGITTQGTVSQHQSSYTRADHLNNAWTQHKVNLMQGDPGTSQSQMPVQASRANTGKLRYSMVDPLFLTELTKVLEFGAQKYDRDNWKKGLKYQSVIDSVERHLIAFRNNEDVDDESGCLHLAHAACNLMFLINYFKRKLLNLDDR